MSEKKTKKLDAKDVKDVKPTYDSLFKTWRESDQCKDQNQKFMDLLGMAPRQGMEILIEAIQQPYMYITIPATKDKPEEKLPITFFDQPASTKYHGSEFGGLVKHVLGVFCKFQDMRDKYHLPIDHATTIIVCLLHDFCKWSIYQPRVTVNNYFDERGHFKFEDPCWLGHGEESVIKLQEFIHLTDTEKLMIRWHMGPFDDALKSWNVNKVKEACPLAMWLFIADYTDALENGMDE